MCVATVERCDPHPRLVARGLHETVCDEQSVVGNVGTSESGGGREDATFLPRATRTWTHERPQLTRDRTARVDDRLAVGRDVESRTGWRAEFGEQRITMRGEL